MSKVRKRTWQSSGEEKTAWVVDYFDRNKRRHIKTFTKKKDADAAFHKIHGELIQGIHTAPSESLTIADAAPGWLDDAENGTHETAGWQATLSETRNVDPELACQQDDGS